MLKIVFVTDDHQTISAHFGRASYYDVVTIEEGKVISRESRSKPGHEQFAGEAHEQPGHLHGHGPAAQGRHNRMVAVIRDCQVLIGRGMGQGAYENLKDNGIQSILTDLQEIEQAIEAYLNGNLDDHPERVH